MSNIFKAFENRFVANVGDELFAQKFIRLEKPEILGLNELVTIKERSFNQLAICDIKFGNCSCFPSEADMSGNISR